MNQVEGWKGSLQSPPQYEMGSATEKGHHEYWVASVSKNALGDRLTPLDRLGYAV